jgi:hypothetical protein
MPNSTAPASTTRRGPKRSLRLPQPNAAMPIVKKFSVIAAAMPARDQPVSAAIGAKKKGSENIAPMPTQVANAPTATTTQP